MQPDDRDTALLWDMLSHAKLVRSFVVGKTWTDYENDPLLQAGVERHVITVGEAAWSVSKPFQEAHPQIAWRAISAQRHRLVHDYGQVMPEMIWTVEPSMRPG